MLKVLFGEFKWFRKWYGGVWYLIDRPMLTNTKQRIKHWANEGAYGYITCEQMMIAFPEYKIMKMEDYT